MAVWIYAYGKNGLTDSHPFAPKKYTDLLNNIKLNETKILDSIKESEQAPFSIRKHYTENRGHIEQQFQNMTAAEYKAYLDSIKLPYIEIDKIIDYLIAEGEKRENEKKLQFDFAYEQFKNGKVTSKWEMNQDGFLVNRLFYFDDNEGIRISFLNDLICISGPFTVFSNFLIFQKTISSISREYYHSYFKQLLNAFKSNFILWTHEWSGLNEDEDEDFNSSKLNEQSDWTNTSSNSIHNMDRFYYEQLS